MSHAVQSDPEECCGLVVGADGARFRRVHRLDNEMTRRAQAEPHVYPRDNRSGFYMNPAELDAVCRQAEADGERVTAIYHSHVGAGAYMSPLDYEHAVHELAPFPDADWIVLAVFDRSVREVSLFRRGAGGFHGHRVPIESASS